MNTTELKRLGFGVECEVFEVNSQIVCKSFAYCRDRDRPEPKRAQFAYRMQRIAHRYGLAPRPLAIEGNQYYSERAESFTNTGYEGNWCDFKESEEFQEFVKQLKNAFRGWYSDDHSGNIARLPNGKLCCIDFGVCGMKSSKLGQLLADKLGIVTD